MKKFTTSVLCAVASLCGCAGVASDDGSASEFGVYQDALVSAAGVASCDSFKKAAICHRPPGNPANAHTICVGAPAVAPHLKHHPDSLGACGQTPSHPDTDGPGHGESSGDDGSPRGDGGELEFHEGGSGGRGHSGADAGIGGTGGGTGGGPTDPETGLDAGASMPGLG